MNQIFSFAWKVMFGSWIAFLFLDVLRPGFVSDLFFVHWFFLAALGCGGAAMASGLERTGHGPVPTAIHGILVGMILALLVWRAGEAFGDLRIFLSMLAFVLPWGLMRAFRE